MSDGYWVDEGWYDFFRDNYSASMTATTRDRTGRKGSHRFGRFDEIRLWRNKHRNSNGQHLCPAVPLYLRADSRILLPRVWLYGTYWRLLGRLTSGTTARFQFAKNIYSTYNQRVHFTPVWFPDGSYTVNTHVMDIWTPAGMLCHESHR
ncbi:MAG: hypothetical protein ACLU9S_03340 [Oscillospiraceae bacterium]